MGKRNHARAGSGHVSHPKRLAMRMAQRRLNNERKQDRAAIRLLPAETQETP